MRIISGLARGRKLYAPGQSKGIRPTADRAKEALFSILGELVVGATVLDLYAGTGALGFEALSRGAKDLVLVDYHQNALKLIRKNRSACCQGLQVSSDLEPIILRHDLRKGLPREFGQGTLPGSFDLIFLDPPYDLGLAQQTLQDIDSSRICAAGCLVVAEERSGQTLPEAFSRLLLTDHRRYGDSAFWLYTLKEQESTHQSITS